LLFGTDTPLTAGVLSTEKRRPAVGSGGRVSRPRPQHDDPAWGGVRRPCNRETPDRMTPSRILWKMGGANVPRSGFTWVERPQTRPERHWHHGRDAASVGRAPPPLGDLILRRRTDRPPAPGSLRRQARRGRVRRVGAPSRADGPGSCPARAS